MDDPRPVLVNNHHQDGWFAVAIVATVVETLFFALRIYCRRIKNARWWLDDYLVAIAYASCLFLNACGIAITKTTWDGHHTVEVLAADPDAVVLFLKLQIPLGIAYVLASVFPKMAIVALFIRVFINRRFRIVCWMLEIFFVCWTTSNVVAILSLCTPFSANWQLGALAPGEHCNNIDALYKSFSIPNVVTDVLITVLPTPIIWKLQTSTSERIGILSTFFVILIGLGFSIARLVAFFDVFSSQDVLWTSAYTGILTTLEPCGYFLVSCMLTFRLLLKAPYCIRRRKSHRGGGAREEDNCEAEKSTRRLFFGRQRSGTGAAVAVTSHAETETGSVLGEPSPAATRHGKAVDDCNIASEPLSRLTAAEQLNKAHNGGRYASTATATYGGPPGNQSTLLSSVGTGRGGESITVTQEVTVTGTS